MSREAVIRFLSEVKDEGLVAKARAAADPAALIAAAAAAAGHRFTAEEFRQVAPTVGRQLSEEELDRVAGGVPACGPVASQFMIGSIGPLGQQLASTTFQTPGSQQVPGLAPLG